MLPQFLTPNDIRKNRLETCSTCKHLYLKTFCDQCACPVEFKTKFLYSTCPANKWKDNKLK